LQGSNFARGRVGGSSANRFGGAFRGKRNMKKYGGAEKPVLVKFRSDKNT